MLFRSEGRNALIATGAFLPSLVLLSWPALKRIDASTSAPTEELGLLDAVPMFASLPLAAKEQLARSLVPVRVAAGDDIIREGDIGDRFYIVSQGRLDVTSGRLTIGELQRGDSFGEIALLRDVPRTATVTARGESLLYALERADFLDAATGHAAGRAAGEAVVAERLVAPAPD